MAQVTIYTRKLCGFCTAAKNLLSKKKVDFIEYDAGISQQLRKAMIQRSGGASTYPQIFIGDKHIGGCDELHALERAGKLDAMLQAKG